MTNANNRKVNYVWEGKNGKFFAHVSYWIGTGYQNVEMEVTEQFFKSFDAELYNL